MQSQYELRTSTFNDVLRQENNSIYNGQVVDKVQLINKKDADDWRKESSSES